MNLLPPIEGRLLKHATRQLLDEFPNLEMAASCCRAPASLLSRYQNFERPEFMPLDIVRELERACGKHHITKCFVSLAESEYPEETSGVISELLDVPPALGRLVEFVHNAKSHDSPGGVEFTEGEKREYLKLRSELDRELLELDAAVECDGLQVVAAE